MKIAFSHHSLERKTERNSWLIQTDTYRETRKSRPELESLLRKKGTWYVSRRDEIDRFYCIVNQLEVYCGIGVDDEIVITTYYPYSKNVKRRLFPRGKPSYDRFYLT